MTFPSESARRASEVTTDTGKAPWHPPTMDEVDYSQTEASGVGGVYDFVVYSGSTGP